MNYAPIIIFAFNRLDSLRHTVDSLLLNNEAKDSDLYVFVDGARPNKAGEQEKVCSVQEYVKTITGFRSVTWRFADSNKGLAASVISGTTEVIEKYGKVIVVEDDLMLAKNFLSFMNQGLNRYEHNPRVFSICGYSNKVNGPDNYFADSYFCTRSSSWGWATWTDRWNSVDWELKDWNKFCKYKKAFNKWGGSDCWKMLDDWHLGRNKSWAIRFCFSQFLQNKLSLFPLKSLVKNDGFDGDGTNCKRYSRFKFELNEAEERLDFRFPEDVVLNKHLYKQALWYHSIPIRIWSRIMYIIKR